MVVYASPLYHFTVNAEMKTFIERTLPVLEPFFLQHNGRTHHPLRDKHPKIVVLSVAGLPDGKGVRSALVLGKFYLWWISESKTELMLNSLVEGMRCSRSRG